MPLRHIRLIAIGALLVATSGCDTGAGAEAETRAVASFDGIRNVAEGPTAALTAVPAGLHFDAPTGGRLRVETDGAAQADLHFNLSGLSEGAVFTSEVISRNGRVLAGLSQRRRGEVYETSATWTTGSTATLEALDEGHVVYSVPLATTSSGTSIGTTSDPPTSKHYDERGHIVYDFVGEDGDGRTSYTPPDGSAADLQITHLRIVVDDAWQSAVAAVRFTTPRGSGLTLFRESITVSPDRTE